MITPIKVKYVCNVVDVVDVAVDIAVDVVDIAVDVAVSGPNAVAKCSIDPQPDGRYSVTYIPVEVGMFDVQVLWNGRNIHSQFTCKHGVIVAVCTFRTSFIYSKQTRLKKNAI